MIGLSVFCSISLILFTRRKFINSEVVIPVIFLNCLHKNDGEMRKCAAISFKETFEYRFIIIIPDFDEAVCSVNFGGEGIYLDIDLKYLSSENERRQVHFATGKTLGENTFDFYRMSLIAGECSMLLNGDGCKVKNNTKTILILDNVEADIITRSLELQAAFNNDVNRSNSEVYDLLQAVNPYALKKFLENENDEELEV